MTEGNPSECALPLIRETVEHLTLPQGGWLNIT